AVLAGSAAELGEDMPEAGLDGLDADVELGCRLAVGVTGDDEAGYRLLGGCKTDEGGYGFRFHGCGSAGEFPVAGLQVGPGAEGDQALPGRTEPGDRCLQLAGGAQPAGVGDLQQGQGQGHSQALDRKSTRLNSSHT